MENDLFFLVQYGFKEIASNVETSKEYAGFDVFATTRSKRRIARDLIAVAAQSSSRHP